MHIVKQFQREGCEIEQSIVCLFSRTEYVKKFATAFHKLDVEPKKTELLFIQDNNDPVLADALKAITKSRLWGGAVIVQAGDAPVDEFSMIKRRERIAFLHGVLASLVEPSSKYVFGFEDDTIMPPTAIKKLRRTMDKDHNVGFVEGIQVGRHVNVRMIGAWTADNVDDPTMMETLPMYTGNHLQRIDAGGLYCFGTRAFLYKNIVKQCPPGFGPDVSFGLDIRRRGYDCYADFSLLCGHMTKDGIIRPNKSVRTMAFKKLKGEWVYSGKGGSR